MHIFLLHILSNLGAWNIVEYAYMHKNVTGSFLWLLTRFTMCVCLCCRYINYISQMVADTPVIPHTRPLMIQSLVMYPVPLFNKMKWVFNYTLFNEMFRTFFFANIIGLPGHRNRRKSVLEITKIYYFLYSNYKIIEQEMNKMAIQTHVIFRPRNAMFSLSKT